MNARTLKDKLVKGETVYGTFFQHAINPAMVDFLPEGALDFVIVTPEHTALDLAEFLPIRYALASKGSSGSHGPTLNRNLYGSASCEKD